MQSGRITAAPVGGRTTSELIRTQGGRTTAELAGDYQLQQKSFKELIVAFLTGLLLIFITALLFSNRFSIAIPLTFCSLVPPTIGLLGCILFRIPLDVSSFSGLISVTGIAVANCFMALSAIESNFDHDNTSTPHSNLTTDSTSPTKSASKKITVATTCFNHTGESNLRNETRLSDAKNSPLHGSSGIIKGMLSRLRPILMTNLAAMAGFIPIAIGLSSGDEILRPFSIAVISGLFGALYTTLILFPLFYRHFASVPFQKS
jgi:Cu/Ag efflux pump CusA